MPSPLAATIVFTGLILHLQTDPLTDARRAVLVDAKPSHIPELVVANSHRVTHSGTWKIIQTGTATRPWRYDLSGARVHVVAQAGNLAKSVRFREFVPHLPALLKGNDDPLPALRDPGAQLAAGTAAYLDYATGTLDVPVCYKAAAVYTPPLPGGPRCVAREVDLTLAVNTDWEIQDVDDPSRRIVFKRNAIVQIQNDSTSRGQHQKHYAQLLAGGTEVLDVTDSDLECTPQCTLRMILPTRGPSVECSNNQWP